MAEKAAVVRVRSSVHKRLQKYCNENSLIMMRVTERLITRWLDGESFREWREDDGIHKS